MSNMFVHNFEKTLLEYSESVRWVCTWECGKSALNEHMVFILYKLYILCPYTNPTIKTSHHRKLYALLHLKTKTNIT